MIWQGLERKYDPLQEWGQLSSEFDRLFGLLRGGSSGGYPPVNVAANDETVEVTAMVPGMEPGDVNLSVEGRVLTLSTESKATADDKDEGVAHERERSQGSFTRQVRLPYEVDPGRVEAKLQHGILTVKLPRSAEQKPRTIKIK